MPFGQLKRRQFIALLGSAAAYPATGWGQEAKLPTIPRIGCLMFGAAAASAGRVEVLGAALRDLGYVEGKNIVMETMWAKTVDELPALAAELVRRNVNVIFAPSSTEVEPARQATHTIPIVFSYHADPVGIGHVASLPRPGGNITGLTMLLTDLSAKELEILKDAVPQAERIGVLWNPTTPSHAPALKAIEAGAERLRVKLRIVPARTRDDFPTAFATMVDERVDALLVVSSPLARVESSFLAELELKHRLPAMFGTRWNVEAGGLMSYAADLDDLTRRAAVYIDKILKGTKPADLPVEQASKYQLVINLKTAKALGIDLPPVLLARADEVIE
jgi:putative tryptophan/tyrosine transport system substrate-binding protein